MNAALFERLLYEEEGVALAGQVLAGNLPQPQDFTLTIDVNVATTRMTVEDLMTLPDPVEPDE